MSTNTSTHLPQRGHFTSESRGVCFPSWHPSRSSMLLPPNLRMLTSLSAARRGLFFLFSINAFVRTRKPNSRDSTIFNMNVRKLSTLIGGFPSAK